MNYVADARARMRTATESLGGLADERMEDLYTLLLLVKGENATLKDVHDVWAVWQDRVGPHKQLKPFSELTEGVQQLDVQWCNAVTDAARATREEKPVTTVPKVVKSLRRRLHEVCCPTERECRYSTGTHPGNPSVRCIALDELHDQLVETTLHDASLKLEREHDMLTDRGRRTLGAGLMYGAELTSPYEEVTAYDPELHEIHPSEERPDCPFCVKGSRHYHRKSDGTPVAYDRAKLR